MNMVQGKRVRKIDHVNYEDVIHQEYEVLYTVTDQGVLEVHYINDLFGEESRAVRKESVLWTDLLKIFEPKITDTRVTRKEEL